LADFRADAEPVHIAREVAIGGLVAVDVLDLDLVAVTGLPAIVGNDAIAGSVNGRAGGGGEIDAGMQFPGLEDGVDAIAEARAQGASAFERAAIEEALAGLAVGIVEMDRA